MGIGVQGEPSAEVSQHPGYRFHVYPVLEGQGGKGVPIPYNKDKTRNPSKIKGFRACPYSFSNKNILRSRLKGGVEK